MVYEEKHHKTNKNETHTGCFILRHSEYRHKAQLKSHGYISGGEISHVFTHKQTNLWRPSIPTTHSFSQHLGPHGTAGWEEGPQHPVKDVFPILEPFRHWAINARKSGYCNCQEALLRRGTLQLRSPTLSQAENKTRGLNPHLWKIFQGWWINFHKKQHRSTWWSSGAKKPSKHPSCLSYPVIFMLTQILRKNGKLSMIFHILMHVQVAWTMDRKKIIININVFPSPLLIVHKLEPFFLSYREDRTADNVAQSQNCETIKPSLIWTTEQKKLLTKPRQIITLRP